MADVRINTLFLRHPKTIKLQKKAGPKAVLALIQLWFWVAENRPKGELYGMDAEDIGIAANWDGDNLKLISLLTELRWLDFDGEIYHIHDWQDHNPWLFGSPDRKEHSQKAAKARWDKKLGKESKNNDECSSMPDAMPNDALSINEHCTEQESAMPNECSSMPDAMPQYQYQYQNHLQIQDQFQDHIQKERETHAQARDARSSSLAEFNRFYENYPLKVGRVKAEAAWLKHKLTDATPIIEALQAQQARRKVIDAAGGFVPHWRNPATWLNQRGWEDEELPLPETSAAIAKFEPRQQPVSQFERNRQGIAAFLAMGERE
jgi:hypothetical protein